MSFIYLQIPTENHQSLYSNDSFSPHFQPKIEFYLYIKPYFTDSEWKKGLIIIGWKVEISIIVKHGRQVDTTRHWRTWLAG